MGEDTYNIGKDIAKIEAEIVKMQTLIQDIYEVISYNLKKEHLEQVKEGKK